MLPVNVLFIGIKEGYKESKALTLELDTGLNLSPAIGENNLTSPSVKRGEYFHHSEN